MSAFLVVVVALSCSTKGCPASEAKTRSKNTTTSLSVNFGSAGHNKYSSGQVPKNHLGDTCVSFYKLFHFCCSIYTSKRMQRNQSTANPRGNANNAVPKSVGCPSLKSILQSYQKHF
jgi:hypothetical protein